MNRNLPIPRDNVLLTLPIIILYLLEYSFNNNKGAFIRELNQYINRTHSQIGEALRKLKLKKYIYKTKIGREYKIYITEVGTQFIENYTSIAKEQIENFHNFICNIKADIDFNKSNFSNSTKNTTNNLSLNKEFIQNQIEDILQVLSDTNLINRKQLIEMRDSLVQVFIDDYERYLKQNLN